MALPVFAVASVTVECGRNSHSSSRAFDYMHVHKRVNARVRFFCKVLAAVVM